MRIAKPFHEIGDPVPGKGSPALSVLFITRASLFAVKGGDTTQVVKTAQALQQLSVRVDIRLCNDKSIVYSIYDLIHFFNIGHPADMLGHIRMSGLPYVVSTIYVDYSKPEDRRRSGIKDLLLNGLGRNAQEYLKTVGKAVLRHERIMDRNYLWMGHKRSVKKVLRDAAVLLPNSANEYKRLVGSYGISKEHHVVPNAADGLLFNCSREEFSRKDRQMVLCVARIELLKNQLNLIRALNGSPYDLYLVGSPAPNHFGYYKACKKISASNIHFISEMKQEELVQLYKKAKVHILPSWFETTGLASLEALYCGCNIVVTERGDTKEYFDSEHCIYCDPASPDSIRSAVDLAASQDPDISHIEWMRSVFNWEKAGAITLEAYRQVLMNTKQ